VSGPRGLPGPLSWEGFGGLPFVIAMVWLVASGWQREALCGWAVRTGRAEADLWFPVSRSGEDIRVALEWCAACPVRMECGDEADQFGLYGVWGGRVRTLTEARSLRNR